MIKSIYLNNWRSHAETMVEFGKGTNLIIGIMGSGKSSLMEGICFGLYGTFPSIESRKLKISDLFRNGCDECSIGLTIELEGKEYLIERKLTNKKSKHSAQASISCNGKLIEQGNKPVTNYISKLLGVDYDLFTRAIYSDQNNIDYFIGLNPKKRKEEFDSLLGLDKFENARANVTTLINRNKIKRNGLEQGFDSEKSKEMEKELEINEGKRRELMKEVQEFEKNEGVLLLELKKTEAEHIELKNRKKEIEKINEETIKTKTIIQTYSEQIKKETINEKEIEQNQKRIILLEESIKKIDLEIKEKSKAIAEKNKELGRLEGMVKRKQEMQENLNKMESFLNIESKLIEKEKLRDEVFKNQINIESFKKEIEEIKGIIKHGTKGDKECPLCGSEISREKLEEKIKEKIKLMEKQSGELKKLESETTKKSRKLEVLENELKKQEETEKKRKLILSEIERINFGKKELEIYTNDLGKEGEKLDDLKAERSRMEREKNQKTNILEKLNEIKKTKEVLVQKQKELVLLEKKISDIEFNKERYEEIEKRVGELRLNLEKTKINKNSFEKELEYLNKIIITLNKEINEKKKISEQIIKLAKIEEELTIYKNTLMEVQIYLRDELTKSINTAMDEMWKIFYPYGDFERLRIKITEKDYVFEVFNQEWKPLESTVSGGERACAALTLRVALSTILTPNLSWLIMDEPTHNLDKHAIALLSETLQIKLPEVIYQTFVITHEELLSGANFSKSYKLVRNKGKGEPTQIEVL